MTDLTKEEIEMKEDTDVLGHIRCEDAKRERKAEEEGWSCVFYVAEEIADEYDNVYDYEFEMALQAYSDCYKESVGIRPALKRDEWTLSDVREMIHNL